MRILLLYPNFRIPFLFTELAALGARATIVHPTTSSVPADLPLEVEASLPLDIHGDPEAAQRTLQALHRRQPFDVIFTTTEACALFCARLARSAGLRGMDPHTALLARDKSRMRAAFRDAGLHVPAFAVGTPADGSLPAGLRFPVIAKPVSGFASQGVVRANDQAQLRAALATIGEINRELLDTLSDAKVGRMSGIIVEEYIEGTEYAADTFSQDGTVYVLSVCEKNDLVGPYFEERSYITPARLSGATLRRTLDEIAGGVLALGITDGAAHVEFRVRDGVPYIIEIGARVGGSGLAHHFAYHTVGARPVQLVIANLLGGADVSGLTTAPVPHGAAANYLVPTGVGGIVADIDGLDAVRRRPDTLVLQFLFDGDIIPPYPKFNFYPAFVISQHRDYDEAAAFHRYLDQTVRVRFQPAAQPA